MLRSLVAFTALVVIWDLWWNRSWKRPAGAGAMPTAAAGAADTTQACKLNPNLKQRPPWALFCLKLDNSCYARYSCGNHWNVVVKLVQVYKFLGHFTSVLWQQFAVNDTFLTVRVNTTSALSGWVQGLFALRYFRSFHTGNFRSLEWKFPGTFAPGSECSREHSFQGANVPGNIRSTERYTREWTVRVTSYT